MSEPPVVHLVAKTHLDVGFTALAATVVDTYVERYIPAALALGAELRARGGPERFVWTTGSWLVHTFLERADREGRAAAEAAIEVGDLAWHALPFTTHTELADPPLIEAGLAISARLDHRFGRRTIAAKLTDVPGHTRGLVPLLAAAGVELLHIGVNPVARVPDVPPVFRWRSPDGAEVTVVYQAGGYGDLTEVAGCTDRLAFAHTGDNLGPPPVDAVLASFAGWRERVPGAEVRGSTLDAFARSLRPVLADLPVVTAEIGDTWIHGVGSDPQKVGRLRELLRLRRAWLDEGMVAPDDSRLRGFHEALLLVVEHTWGMDEKTHLPDRVHWSRADLPALRAEPATEVFEASWAEQRAYVDAAVDGLESEGLRKAARSVLAARGERLAPWSVGDEIVTVGVPTAEDLDDAGDVVSAPGPIEVGPWELAVSPHSGAVIHLVDRVSGAVLADADHPLFAFAHQGFDEADYRRHTDAYLDVGAEDEWWAYEDNTKPGIDAAGALSGWWPVASATVHEAVRWSAVVGPRRSESATTAEPGRRRAVVVRLTMAPPATTVSGSPTEVLVSFSDASPPEGPSRLAVDLRWADKPANRLPEATWLGLVPRQASDAESRLVLDKLGQDVDPTDVVEGGGRLLHAVGDGLRWRGPDGELAIETLDAPLVAPGGPHLLDPDAPLDLGAGAWICLHTNVWGTNFPMWSEGPASFRLTLTWTPTPPTP